MYFFEKEQKKQKEMLISSSGEVVSYGDYDRFYEKWKGLLEPRSLIMIFCSNTCGSVLGYLASLRHRVVPVLLDAKMDGQLREELIKRYDPDALYVPEHMIEDVKKEKEKIELETYGYCLIKREKTGKTELNDKLGLLLTTSGSTGSPKLVRQSYDNIQANAESIKEYLELDETERPITTLPMNYTYGLSIINSHILSGATILLTEYTLFDMRFWKFFGDEGATSFGGVPFTYEMLKKLRFFSMELPSLRTMTQAGGRLPETLHKQYAEYAKEHGKKFIVMYGQTEATARMSYLPFEQTLDKIGSIGVAIPGGRFEIQEGELVYHGPNVTLGYAQCQEDLKKGDERLGVLHTGDMARVDEDGFYYIVGRKKRFLKILGNRVNLDEAERLLKIEFDGAGIACAGIDDQLKIYVEKEAGLKEEEIIAFLSGRMKLNPGVFEVIYIDQIPVNESGKIQYKKLGK